MPPDKVIHFGMFVRRKRVDRGLTLREAAEIAGITETRMNAVEKMEKPSVYDTTRAGVARAIGMTLDELDEAWSTTPVSPLARKGGYETGTDAFGRTPREAAFMAIESMALVNHISDDEVIAHFRARKAKAAAGNLVTGRELAEQIRAAASSSAKVQKKDDERKKRKGKE